jgi:stage II sporulation protein AA (anti-sigma F factor antagonist)
MDLELLEGESAHLSYVKLSGRLDTFGVDRVETRFNAVTVARGRDAVIDLVGVSFITSMGIRMLVAAANALRLRGRRLVLLNPQGVVDDYLRATDLYAVIPMARTRDEAERLCGSG